MSVHKKFQPNRSSRLAGYREHIYECLVLLYRYRKGVGLSILYRIEVEETIYTNLGKPIQGGRPEGGGIRFKLLKRTIGVISSNSPIIL